MKLAERFRFKPRAKEAPAEPSAEDEAALPGDRGIPPVNRTRSLQSRISSLLAMALMSALGLGLLGFYYAHAFSQTRRARMSAQAKSQARAEGEMALPALGPIHAPVLAAAGPDPPPGLAQQLLGPAPPLPDLGRPEAPGSAAPEGPEARAPRGGLGRGHRARPLSGSVFATRSSDAPVPLVAERAPAEPVLGAADESLGAAPPAAGGPSASGELRGLLRPTVTPAVRAQLLPTRRLLLPKGAFIDCTLETAIDSSLPGMTTCITATDTFGADGEVVLLERGTKLVGETRGEVHQGGARVFVLWTEARTPTGVVVPLASPGTDELGRAGLSGTVNRHFLDRFGAAILVSVVNGAVQAAAQSTSSHNGAVVVNPAGSTDIMTEVLRDTVAIPPTVTKPQGDRIQVLVARDLDFRSVYELRTTREPLP